MKRTCEEIHKEEEEEEEEPEAKEKEGNGDSSSIPYVAYRVDKSHYINFAAEIGEICQCYTGICPLHESALDALDEVSRFWVSQLFEKAAAEQDGQPKTPDCSLQPRSFGAFLAPAQLLRMEKLMEFFHVKSLLKVYPWDEGETNDNTKEEESINTYLDNEAWAESIRRATSEQGEDPTMMDREVLRLRVELERNGRLGRRLGAGETKVVSFVKPIGRRYIKFREWAGVDKLRYKVSRTLCEIAAQLLMEWTERIAHGSRETAQNLPADAPLTGSHIKAHIISLGPNWVCPPPLFA